MLFMVCGKIFKNDQSLDHSEASQNCNSDDVCSIGALLFQGRGWRTCKNRQATLRPETIRGCYASLSSEALWMITADHRLGNQQRR